MTGALPEGWLVLEGTSDPSPPVDRTALRAVLACVRGEKVPASKTAIAVSSDIRSLYANLCGVYSRLVNRKKDPEFSVGSWEADARHVLEATGIHSTGGADARAAHYTAALRAYKASMEREYNLGAAPRKARKLRRAPKK